MAHLIVDNRVDSPCLPPIHSICEPALSLITLGLTYTCPQTAPAQLGIHHVFGLQHPRIA
eukprot:scaffold272625_cov26-Tisochrysis_lutea.AAC.2